MHGEFLLHTSEVTPLKASRLKHVLDNRREMASTLFCSITLTESCFSLSHSFGLWEGIETPHTYSVSSTWIPNPGAAASGGCRVQVQISARSGPESTTVWQITECSTVGGLFIRHRGTPSLQSRLLLLQWWHIHQHKWHSTAQRKPTAKVNPNTPGGQLQAADWVKCNMGTVVLGHYSFVVSVV